MDLNQVTVPCIDYEASVQFYKKLGLRQIVDSPPRYARFETDTGSTFSIHMVESVCSGSNIVVYFEVEDLDATVKSLIEQGLEFDTKPQDQEWLWKEARLSDPAGNRLCIYHAGENRRFPPWRVEDGVA
jgi:hydroxymethylpyrimidine/phosphomethylpyrimidine kinase